MSLLDGVLLVVPCYNEAARLDVDAFLQFTAEHTALRLLFVDDGSTDDTARVLESLRAQRPDAVSILRLPENRGKAEAVRRGMLTGLDTPARFVGYWDADLATPLDALQDFCRVLEERPWVDVAVGSRVQLLGREIVRHRMRHYAGRAFATVVSMVLDLGIYDTQCGAKLFRSGVATRRLFLEPFRTRWIFDVEIFARMVRASRTEGALPVERLVYELPLARWCDVRGSKLRGSDFAIAFLDLVGVAATLHRPLPPVEPAVLPEGEQRAEHLSETHG